MSRTLKSVNTIVVESLSGHVIDSIIIENDEAYRDYVSIIAGVLKFSVKSEDLERAVQNCRNSYT